MKAVVLAAVVLLAACAPVSQPVQTAEQGRPAFAANTFITADGTKLPLRRWLPAGKPRAVVVALHGFNDYNNAFEMPGKFLRARGIAVYAYDQRGFGKSPMTGIWADSENLRNDLKQAVLLAKKRHPKTPVYVLGESMGGAVAVSAMADPDFPKVQGVILSAPALWGGEAMNPLMRGSLWLMAHTMPGKTMTGQELKILASDNLEMLRAMWFDKLIIKETRVDAIYGLVGLMGEGYHDVPAVKAPVLLLYGDKDEVIPRHVIDDARPRFSTPVTFKTYPQGYHMLMRDLQRGKVMRDVVKWVDNSNSL